MKALDSHHPSPEVTLEFPHISLAERNHMATITAREAEHGKRPMGFMLELCGIDVTEMYD